MKTPNRGNAIYHRIAYQRLIGKHFPEINPKSLVSDKTPNEIIRHISRVKKPHTKEYYVSSQTRKAKMYVTSLAEKKYDRYLDIGAGTGHLTKEIANLVQAKKVVGLDVEEWAEYKDQDRMDFVKIYDGRTIPYPDNYFDLVSMIFTIHHIPNHQRIINEAIRVTKKNGTILIVEHDVRNKHDIDIIDFDHKLFMIEKVDDYKEYQDALKNYYSRYFSLSQLERKFIGKFENVHRYPRDILRRYVAVLRNKK